MDPLTVLFFLFPALLAMPAVLVFFDDHPRTVHGWLAPHTDAEYYATLLFNLLHGFKNAVLVAAGCTMPLLWTRFLAPLYGWRYPFGLLRPRSFDDWLDVGRNDYNNDVNEQS